MNRRAALLACLIPFALLSACGTPPIQRKDGTRSAREFHVKNLAKRDVDTVIEIHQQELLASLRTLTLKLYKRNPTEWRKSGHGRADAATAALFDPVATWSSSSAHPGWETSLRDAWRDDYTGDRVAALINGLLTMHMAAFDDHTEFYMLTEVDAQKLYNAARNTEAVAWKLATAKKPDGTPVLLSNGVDANGIANLSFEREFGRLIGLQDALAKIIEDKSNRAIRFGVVNVASMVFLPI